MTGRVFVDSNIWCYILDPRDEVKQQKAAEAITNLSQSCRIFSSTQVLSEVYSVLTTKIGIATPAAKDFVRRIATVSSCIAVQPAIIERAIDVSVIEQIHYWDGLILSAALEADCDTLLTEDLQNGSRVQGIRIVSPFLT